MYNLITFLFLLNFAAIFGWTFRPNEYRSLCAEFDRIGAETVFSDANMLIETHGKDIQHTEWRIIPAHVRTTNSLTNFGLFARVGPEYVTINSGGMGSVRMGIILAISTNDIEQSTARYFQTHEYETTEIPIYPTNNRSKAFGDKPFQPDP